METDPLQQLRDVHTPPDPSWWPPAPGWWLLAAALLGLIVWLVLTLARAHQRRAPLRAAGEVLAHLKQRFDDGETDADNYLHASNEVLKRLLVRAYGQAHYAPMAGQEWLDALDSLSASTQFTAGPGRALGDARFSHHPEVDVAALHMLLQGLLQQVAGAEFVRSHR